MAALRYERLANAWPDAGPSVVQVWPKGDDAAGGGHLSGKHPNTLVCIQWETWHGNASLSIPLPSDSLMMPEL